MKKPVILLLSAVLLTSIASYVVLKYERLNTVISKQNNREGSNDEEKEEQSGAAKQLNSWFQAKGYPNPENLSAKYQKAWKEYKEIKKKSETHFASRLTSASNWSALGHCIDEDGNRIGGRVVCMAIDPNNTNNLWVGSASGGIWRSTNAGSSWTAVPTNLPVLGVSAILVDPSNSNIIYAGTGEVYHTEVQVMGFNVWKTRGTYGIGVIKSTDGGATWSQVMTKVSSDLFAISSMAFLPGNSSTIYACATDGVYRSTNSGGSWSQINTNINIRDIAINPSNTDEIVLSVGNMTNAVKGIFRTTNGNSATPTWTQITSGLPASYNGSIKLDNSGSGMLAASIGRGSGNEVYRSTDFGSTWSALSSSSHTSYQFWFAHTIAVNPFFTDSLIYGGVSIYRHRTIATAGRISITGLHADHHDIKFDPTRRGTVYVCNDGGVYKSTDGGVNFSAINTGLNATQFYASLGVSRQSASVMIGGLQDNGQVLYNGTNWVKTENNGWGGGDGTACAIHPTNDDIMLAGRDAKQFFRTSNGGTSGSAVTTYWGFVGDSRTGFVPPVAFAPSNGNIVYTATDNIHRSTDAGANFSNNTLGTTPPYPATTPTAYIEQRHKTAIALAVSHTNENKVYVSTSPFAQYDDDVNNIYVNGNPNVFKTTTPTTTPYTSIKGSLPDRFVMDFAISTNSDDSVYVVLGGFGTSHVYLTPDGGTTWISRGAGLPDVPFNAIVIDPINEGYIYAGCDFGVYVSPDRGATWYDYNTNFYDATLIMDLQIDANNKLIAATHGKGVFRSDLYQHTVLPATLTDFSGTGYAEYNQLKWTVTQEQSLLRYELERSTDGSSFIRVASITAQNSPVEVSYNHNDITSLFETYYRLKMIDIDGTITYSSVVFIRKAGAKNEFSVLGNPFNTEIVLKYKLSRDQKVSVQLLNAAGSLLRKEEYAATAGTGIYTIGGFQYLTPGVYLLKVESGNDLQTIKLMKK
ncbi:MAG: T9SS type A sorting domain-containing protein [Chitinophagaceae bacterium]|nr:T9SS type A sorting domain-containing protein [Chitinophagaceae bacterium]